MKNHCLKILIPLKFFLAIQGLFSQNAPRFNQTVFQMEGQILDVFLQDLNGDSTLDILILHNKSEFPDPHIHRHIAIFLQNNNHFTDHPHQTLTADQDEILFDIGDLDNDAIPELVFLTKDGIHARKYSPTGYSQSLQPVLKASSVFLAHDPSRLKRWPFIQDLNGDSLPELLIPKSNELRIHSMRPNIGYDLIGRLWTSPDFTFSTGNELTLSLQLPKFHLQDFNGDATLDFLALSGERLDVYLLHPTDNPGFIIPLIPPNLRYRMGTHDVNPSVLEPLAPSSSTLTTQDLNGDGHVDVILSKASRASFTKNISQIQIYMNKKARFDILPDQVLTADNFGGEHIIRDFNQDGLQDLALLTFKIGFAQAIKFLITKKAGNSFDCYFMRQDHTYSIKPDVKLSFSRRIKIDDILGSSLCQSFDGDFNGDGIKDLLIGTDIDQLTIFPGSPEGFFTKKSSFKIHAPTSTELWVGDLNRDRFSDILIWYPGDPTRSHQILLIQSENEGSP